MTERTSRRRRRTVPAANASPDDAGYVAVMVAGLVLAVMAAIGLLVDGSIALAAQRQANNLAEQAARAAGQAVDQNSYTAGLGPGVLDPAAARRAAEAYLAGSGYAYTIEIVDARQVVVTVTVVSQTRLVSMVGVDSVTAVGTGRSTQLFGTG